MSTMTIKSREENIKSDDLNSSIKEKIKSVVDKSIKVVSLKNLKTNSKEELTHTKDLQKSSIS